MSERLFQPGGPGTVWYCWYYTPKGKRVRKSTKCRDRRAAAAVLRRLERQANASPHAPQDAAPHSVEDALAHLLSAGTNGKATGTVRMYAEKAGHLLRLIGKEDVNALTVETIGGYIDDRTEEGAARETIRKELSTLRKALKLAKARTPPKFLGDPRAVFPEFTVRYEPRMRYLAPEELPVLLRQLEPARQLWILVAVYTGGRYSEVARLAWEHIDWRMQTILMPGKKTKKARRIVPLHPVLAGILEPQRKGAEGLIVGAWKNVRHDLAKAAKRAKLQRLSPNDLRRTFASWMKQAGVDSKVVAELLGHASTRMVDLVYGVIDQATLARAVAKLPGEWNSDNSRTAIGNGASPVSSVSPDDTDENRPKALSGLVLGVGIEPTTRGFSVRAEVERKPLLSLISGGRRR